MSLRVVAFAVMSLAGACSLPDAIIIPDDTGPIDTPSQDVGDESVIDVVDIVDAADAVDAIDAMGVADVVDVIDVGPPDDGFDPCSVGDCGGAVSISVRLNHSCVVRQRGAVRCWGSGILGDGVDHTGSAVPTPVLVQGLPTGDPAVQVAAGSSFTCARLTSGNVYCWGANGQGQLGHPAAGASSLVPVQVLGLPTGGASSVAAGDDFACAAVSTASVDSIYCWGTSVVTGAVQTTAMPLTGTACGSTSLTAGANHACAVFTCGDVVYCWGSNAHDESSGVASTGGAPVIVSRPTLPAAFGTMSNAVSGGSDDTYTINPSGALYGWGLQSVDQLGNLINGTYTSSSAHLIAGTYSAVSGGDDFACAIRSDGGPYVVCWGSDASGQLGDGATSMDMTAGPSLLMSMNPSQLSAGTHHACAITSSGAVYCWGSNTFGESGAGTGVDPATPTNVVLP